MNRFFSVLYKLVFRKTESDCRSLSAKVELLFVLTVWGWCKDQKRIWISSEHHPEEPNVKDASDLSLFSAFHLLFSERLTEVSRGQLHLCWQRRKRRNNRNQSIKVQVQLNKEHSQLHHANMLTGHLNILVRSFGSKCINLRQITKEEFRPYTAVPN